jgi:hypothetical protein
VVPEKLTTAGVAHWASHRDYNSYGLSRLLGTGLLIHTGTYLVVTTRIVLLFTWDIYFCTWQYVVTGMLLAELAHVLGSRLIPRQHLAK